MTLICLGALATGLLLPVACRALIDHLALRRAVQVTTRLRVAAVESRGICDQPICRAELTAR